MHSLYPYQKDNVLAQFLVVEGSVDEMMLKNIYGKRNNIKIVLQ
tara:strand:+ start:414 stop:545 length:132 start_codon:yes stop_codon:yes gene_type:complete